MRAASAVVALVAIPAIALAQAAPADFARGATIRVDASGTIFRVPLPDDVYGTITHPDLSDLRVFNAAGDPLPHTLRTIPPPASTDADWRSVPFFPMTETQSGTIARTHVRIGADGAVLEVTGDSTGRRATTAYLVDVSRIDGPLATMALTWKTGSRTPFLARVSVLGSSDLDHWRALVSSAAVAQLEHDVSTLTQSEIQLPASSERTRYLQITWPKELADVTLTGVRLRPPPPKADRDIRWRTLTPARTETEPVLQYDTGGLFPVEYLQIVFADQTDAASVLIKSRSGSSSPWTLRHSGLFYSASDTRNGLRNPPARITRTTDRYWSLELSDERTWSSGRVPHLEVGWYPHELVFLAQGTPPFTLAYGSASASATHAPIDVLIARLEGDSPENQVPVVTLDQPRSLGGADALTPAPPVRRFILWAILVLAVCALALLARRVLRD